MAGITRQHILECCMVDKRGRQDAFPEGMSETSALMTMQLIRSLKAGRMNNRTASLLTYDVILYFFRENYGEEILRGAIAALEQYFEKAYKVYGLPMRSHRELVNSYKIEKLR